jgi:NADPH:quinone reductase-like Zn-dependent oxidoreductase
MLAGEATMRALRFDRFGPPSVLQLVDVPPLVAGADEALVAVRAAAVNPSDVKNVLGKFPQTTLPHTPGRDFAGVVTDGPREWQGVAVWGSGDFGFRRDGTHAEIVRVPVRALSRKPGRLDFAEAAAVGTPFITASLGWARATLGDGDLVLVIGAAGSVGGAAVQLARWRGARVLGVVVDDRQSAIARALGATPVVVARDADPAASLRAALGDQRVRVAFDTTGSWLAGCVGVLQHGGRVVAISAPPDGRATFDLRELYRLDGAVLGINSLALTAIDAAAILETLAPGFESGALVAPRVERRPLADAIAAYGAPGKQVLIP